MNVVETFEDQGPIQSTADEPFQGEPFIENTTFSSG